MKTVLSLCDRTGVMVQPWLDAGFRAIIVDTVTPQGFALAVFEANRNGPADDLLTPLRTEAS